MVGPAQNPIRGRLKGTPDEVAAIIASADTAVSAVASYLTFLTSEKRASPKTIENYARDLARFFEFLFEHLEGDASLQDLSSLSVGDFRAFLAHRRRDGLSAKSIARTLSTLRGFYGHLEREGLAINHALRSEEHTSELQSRSDLVCRLLLEKKKRKKKKIKIN